MRRNSTAAAPNNGPAAADHHSSGRSICKPTLYCCMSPSPILDTAVASTEQNSAAVTACRVHTPSIVSRINSVAASGTLYTAAKPAPEAQAISSRAPSSSKPSRLTHNEANAAVISRGATSRPNGEPSPTVTICNSAWPTVAANGNPASGLANEALIPTSGLPYRFSSHQPPPAATPHESSA